MRPSKIAEAVADIQFTAGDISDKLAESDCLGSIGADLIAAIDTLDAIASESDICKLIDTEAPAALINISGMMRRVFSFDTLGWDDAARLERAGKELYILLSQIPPAPPANICPANLPFGTPAALMSLHFKAGPFKSL
jgi:hypothetical protein